MPTAPTLREWGVPAKVREIPAKTLMEGGLDIGAQRLDDGLCCLTENGRGGHFRKSVCKSANCKLKFLFVDLRT